MADSETTARFSKSRALEVLASRAERIAVEQKFDRNNGTAQLRQRGGLSEAEIDRAVEYGRMLAFQQFADSINSNFRFEALRPAGAAV